MIQECIIIRTGADTSDVIVGHRLNDRPLSRAEADHLAHASASAAPSSASEPAKAPAPDNLAREPVAPAPSPAPKPKLNAPGGHARRRHDEGADGARQRGVGVA
jgi:hypothetical protein